MRYKNEAEIKRALGIESWRNLSKGKMLRFAAMMPDMDTEVALKIVEQFPVFKMAAMDVVNAMEKAHESTLSANTKSQDLFYQALQDIREILKVELSRDGLSPDEKKYLIEQIQETGRIASRKDSENKQFLDRAHTKVVLGGVAVLGLGLAFVGGKVMAESKDSPEASSGGSERSLEG